MKVRRIDVNGDWTFGLGPANYAKDNEAVLQLVKTRVKSFKGDWFLDTEAGVDWFRLLGEKDTEEEIKREVEDVILQTPGVLKVNSIEIKSDTITRKAEISVNLNTVYLEDIEIQITI